MIDWLAMAGAAVFFFILSRAAAVQRSPLSGLLGVLYIGGCRGSPRRIRARRTRFFADRGRDRGFVGIVLDADRASSFFGVEVYERSSGQAMHGLWLYFSLIKCR
jgi:hypothetical protein